MTASLNQIARDRLGHSAADIQNRSIVGQQRDKSIKPGFLEQLATAQPVIGIGVPLVEPDDPFRFGCHHRRAHDRIQRAARYCFASTLPSSTAG